MEQKLLPMGHTRHFLMPDGQSSCCGSEGSRIGREILCTCCGRKIHPIGTHPKHAVSFTDLEGIFVNETYGKRVRQAKYQSKYFVAKKHGKIVRLQEMSSFTYNWETGRLYNVSIKSRTNKIVRNITYVAPVYMFKEEFIIKMIQLRAMYLLPEVDIIRDIERALNVKDLFQYIGTLYYHNHRAGDGTELDKVVKHILYCLAYPKFSWINCPIHIAPSAKFRKALKDAKKSKELYNAFFHNNVGKSAITFLNDPLLGKSASGWAAVRFLSMFLNKDKLWEVINSGDIIHLIDETSFFEPTFEKDLKPKVMVGFTKEYGVQRFLNHMFTTGKSAATVRMLVGDSLDMWERLDKELPDWTMSEGRSLKETHDRLARDCKKIIVQNEEIKYTKQERGYENVFGDLEFVLPTDVHNVIDLGDNMNICVGGGGYTQQAVAKDITLVFGMMEGSPELCMEIRRKKLMQAKLVHNDLAKSNWEIQLAIHDWCEKNDIDYSACYDMIEQPEYGGPRPPAALVDNNIFEEINF